MNKPSLDDLTNVTTTGVVSVADIAAAVAGVEFSNDTGIIAPHAQHSCPGHSL